MNYYAHTKEGDPNPEHRQPLKDHLNNTANLAKKFPEKFNAGDWGYKDLNIIGFSASNKIRSGITR